MVRSAGGGDVVLSAITGAIWAGTWAGMTPSDSVSASSGPAAAAGSSSTDADPASPGSSGVPPSSPLTNDRNRSPAPGADWPDPVPAEVLAEPSTGSAATAVARPLRSAVVFMLPPALT